MNQIFGGGNKNAVKEIIRNGASIIDVRSPAEFQGGHVVGSKNIPLQNVQGQLSEIKRMKQPIVLCCASGARSGQATNFLKRNGVDCINGGGWTNVNALKA